MSRICSSVTTNSVCDTEGSFRVWSKLVWCCPGHLFQSLDFPHLICDVIGISTEVSSRLSACQLFLVCGSIPNQLPGNWRCVSALWIKQGIPKGLLWLKTSHYDSLSLEFSRHDDFSNRGNDIWNPTYICIKRLNLGSKTFNNKNWIVCLSL